MAGSAGAVSAETSQLVNRESNRTSKTWKLIRDYRSDDRVNLRQVLALFRRIEIAIARLPSRQKHTLERPTFHNIRFGNIFDQCPFS